MSETKNPYEFQDKARELVLDQVNKRNHQEHMALVRGNSRRGVRTDSFIPLRLDEVYVVWFSKVLQNWKALVSTEIPDGRYYEVTYNGDRLEAYVDTYTKESNILISDQFEAPQAFTPFEVEVPTTNPNA